MDLEANCGMQTMKISELAKATGTKADTIRSYEQRGLLPSAARTQGNYRSFGGEHVSRVSFIRSARELGFSIEQVRALLDLADHDPRDSATLVSLATDHLREVDRKIAGLTALRRELSAVLAAGRDGTVTRFHITEGFGPRDPIAT